tara:strand:- start:2180 stop:2470 length:291 start_codon:yes stop_codon:yes gene_type:complete
MSIPPILKKTLYILFCLAIIVSISIRLTEKQIDTFMSHSVYSNKRKPKVGDIDILGASKFSPECCPHTYTTSSGCLCDTKHENVIISSRGGNRRCY